MLPGELKPEDVRAAVERAAASTGLGRSDQLVRFLRFVVDETLAGRGHLLKEYTIGVTALGRPPRFDPAADSVVRVQARQLRFKLGEYFAGEGRDEPVVIELPKGSYVPLFSTRAATVPNAVPVEPPRSRRRLVGALTFVGVALIALTAIVYSARTTDASVASAPDTAGNSIVVLPFLNLTGSPAEEYISDGLTEELTYALANVPGLRVVARTSAFRFKDQAHDVRDIARQLDVGVVIEGSVRRSDSTVRVTVQVIRAADGSHVMAETFEESARDLLRVQQRVAQSVVARLHPQVAAEPLVRRSTVDAEAFTLYLRARYFWNMRTLDAMRQSIALFEQAIARDSGYALAWAGLAAVHAAMATNGQAPPGVAPPKADAAAKRALALDASLGEAHATLGLMRGFSDWDWEAADREFRRAIELSPNYATAHAWYANTLMARGRLDEALDHLRYAHTLDPLSLSIAYGIGEALVYARRWNLAEAQAQTLLERVPGHSGAYNLLWRSFLGSGRYAEALDAVAKSADSTNARPLVLARLGRLDEARAQVRTLSPTLGANVPYFVASLHAALGDTDAAFNWLEKAYTSRQTDIVSMKIDPLMDPLRQDPRFGDMLRRIGLANVTPREAR